MEGLKCLAAVSREPSSLAFIAESMRIGTGSIEGLQPTGFQRTGTFPSSLPAPGFDSKLQLRKYAQKNNQADDEET